MPPLIARSMIKLLEHGHESHPVRGRGWREWLLWPSEAVTVTPPVAPAPPSRTDRP